MAFLLTLMGGAYLTNYIEENIINPVSNKFHEIKNSIEDTFTEYENDKKREEVDEMIRVHREKRDEIKKKYNI